MRHRGPVWRLHAEKLGKIGEHISTGPRTFFAWRRSRIFAASSGRFFQRHFSGTRPELGVSPLCRPRAAPGAISGAVNAAITAISGISGSDQVERGGPRGLHSRSCATLPRWAAIPRSQLHARALRAAPPLSGPQLTESGFFDVVDF